MVKKLYFFLTKGKKTLLSLSKRIGCGFRECKINEERYEYVFKWDVTGGGLLLAIPGHIFLIFYQEWALICRVSLSYSFFCSS